MAAGGTCLGSDQNACGSPGASCSSCADPDCTYGDCVTAGPAGTTVTPNPMVPNTAQGSSASALSQMSNTMGQWGATIAGIVSGTPTVVTASGARTGSAALSPSQSLVGGQSGMLLLLVGVVVVVFLVIRK